jgi:hypothetical protein
MLELHTTRQRSVRLGDTVFDPITGFEGVAVGIVTYLWVETEVAVMPPKLDKDGQPSETRWFNEKRLGIRGA